MSGSPLVRRERTRLQGAVAAVAAVLDDGVTTIASVHRAVARKPFAALRLAPGVAGVAEHVRMVHDGITSMVYGGLRAAVAAITAAAEVAATFVPVNDEEAHPGSRAEMAVAALNGFAGDRLARSGNPLAVSIELRHRGQRLPIERARLVQAFPNAAGRLALFVHGLACNEGMWSLHAERHYGSPETTYGSLLEADLGHTPLYVRYNTGLHIAHNGRALAQLLDQIVSAWPVTVEEIVLIGHSMGGLVTRSACHHGREANLDWTGRVRHVVFLGSPHRGAPLEKGANIAAWCLGLTDVTRPFAVALNRRSAGIKDLRFGSLCEEDWERTDLDALLSGRTSDIPLLDGARHYFVAATVTNDRRHPFGVAIGDLLVREASASGRSRTRRTQFPLEHARHFGALHHLDLLNHPDVYRQLRQWLAPD
jgi:pimeloyl-ACP methyl ester carboxylesterase